MARYQKAILFYNEKSGQSARTWQLDLIQSHFNQHEVLLNTIILPRAPDLIAADIDQAIKDGIEVFIAAGGDGTVSLVGNLLVNTGLPIGILPLGTGNLLAKELKIPLRLEKALDVITSDESDLLSLDAIKLGSRSFLMNVSVGVSSKVMEETHADEKRRLGFTAYLLHFFRQCLGLQLQRFTIDVDGQIETYSASEVHITNSSYMGTETLQWPGDIVPDDGRFELFIIRAINLGDIVRLLITVSTRQDLKKNIIKSVKVEKYCQVETKEPMKVQADGDMVATTPFRVEVQPKALRIIVPKAASPAPNRKLFKGRIE